MSSTAATEICRLHVRRFETPGTDEHADDRSPSQLSRTSRIMAELKRLQKLFGCTILFTSTPHEKSFTMSAPPITVITNNDGQRLSLEAPRVSPWVTFATLSLSVSRDEVRQFA